MREWNRFYPKPSQRLKNELRKFHFASIDPKNDAHTKVEKALKAIEGLNKKLPNG